MEILRARAHGHPPRFVCTRAHIKEHNNPNRYVRELNDRKKNKRTTLVFEDDDDEEYKDDDAPRRANVLVVVVVVVVALVCILRCVCLSTRYFLIGEFSYVIFSPTTNISYALSGALSRSFQKI